MLCWLERNSKFIFALKGTIPYTIYARQLQTVIGQIIIRKRIKVKKIGPSELFIGFQKVYENYSYNKFRFFLYFYFVFFLFVFIFVRLVAREQKILAENRVGCSWSERDFACE